MVHAMGAKPITRLSMRVDAEVLAGAAIAAPIVRVGRARCAAQLVVIGAASGAIVVLFPMSRGPSSDWRWPVRAVGPLGVSGSAAGTRGRGLAAGLLIARVCAAVCAFAGRERRRRSGAPIRTSMPLYVRDERGRPVVFEAAPQASAWWATVRALMALDDPRDPDRCRLLCEGRVLRPGRSLQASGVEHGDTLDLVDVDLHARRLRLPTLRSERMPRREQRR